MCFFYKSSGYFKGFVESDSKDLRVLIHYLTVRLFESKPSFPQHHSVSSSSKNNQNLVYPNAIIYLFKVNIGSIRTMCEICSNLTIKTKKNINAVALVSLLLTSNKFHTLFQCFFFIEFEQVHSERYRRRFECTRVQIEVFVNNFRFCFINVNVQLKCFRKVLHNEQIVSRFILVNISLTH